jgi:tRNA(Arg) A34 adenosine deaminase TadA
VPENHGHREALELPHAPGELALPCAALISPAGAEAIRQACSALGTHILEGCVLYSSAECCPMCAAAAWWARIDVIYYASTSEDVLVYGGFDDLEIYEELRRPVAERKLPTRQICRGEAVEVWKEFQALPGRAHY